MTGNLVRVLFFPLALLVVFWVIVEFLIDESSIENFIRNAQAHIVIVVLTLLIIKVLSILIPPLPGSYFTIGAIPFIGWWQAIKCFYPSSRFLIVWFHSVNGSATNLSQNNEN